MTDLLANPAIQSGALPFGVALVFAAVLGFSGATPARLAGLAVFAGFLAAYAVTIGLPPLPPKSSGQKIIYIAAFAAIAGLYLDGRQASEIQRRLTGLAVVLLGAVWIGWRKIMAAPSFDHVALLLILAGAAVALFATEQTSEDDADKTIPLLVISLAAAGIAFLGSSASISQNAGALGAALGGVLVLNWPQRRFGLTVTARLVPLVTLAALAAQSVFFTKAAAWIYLLLLPSLFADRLAGRWIPVDHPRASLARPVVVGLLAVVPGAAAVAAAWVTAASSAPSGGY